MTHQYTLLVGGLVIPGGGQPDASAVAWAEDTLLLIGSDDDVRAISRGDSHLIELEGAVVVPLGDDGEARWPAMATLEIGSRADLAVLSGDPRVGPVETVALVRGGAVVRGKLPAPVDWPGGAHPPAMHRSD